MRLRLPRGEPRPPLRRDPRFWAGPAAAALAGLGWYASESLRHRREGAFGYEVVEGIEAGSGGFMRAAEALTGHAIDDGCEVELLVNGVRIFPALLKTIASAERTLCLETYVYWRGRVAKDVSAAVCERARAGVECKVLVDALGGAQMEPSLLREMKEAGAAVCLFRPPKPYALGRLTNRSHRRLLIADGKVGMTGGVGIAGEWEGDAHGPDEWRDSHLLVGGPVVRAMQGAFAEHWLEASGEVLAGEDYLPSLERREDGVPVQLIRSNAGVGDTNTEAIYYLAIASARRRLDLTSAYFVPRPAFTEALCEAAGRGVDVRIVVPGPHIDKGFVRTAGRAAYAELIDAGVRIHEFMPTMLHAKSLAVDDRWAMLGTMNFDSRSFQLHDEVTLGVWSEDFNRRMREVFEADLEHCEEIRTDRWARRRLRMRVAEGAMKFIRREL